jgi:hypothetical protein
MSRSLAFLVLLFIILLSGCQQGKKGNLYYKGNPGPLHRNAYIKLPLGAIKPAGWLRTQLELQAEGLTGNIDEYWPDLVNSSWHGQEGEAWERGPYYLDGLVPLAYLLDDDNQKSKVRKWIEPMLKSSTDSGWYGPAKNQDRWPLAIANKVLMQYYEATGDTVAIDVLLKYFRYLHDSPPDWPDEEWRGVRAMENAVTGYWLYRQTGESWILEVIESIHNNSSDWTAYYEQFPWDSSASADKKIPLNWGADGLTAHVVNNAMAVKYPGLWYQQSLDERFRNASFEAIKKYDLNHGQAGGRFSGDEHLSGKSPDRGTELCSVVEYMYSLEELYAIFGDNALADRLELLTFNALPGTTTPDMWAHQYDQQSNQVLVSDDKRNWSTNGNESNIYGFSPNFGCCLANMHQGWPKFIQHMWMATNDNGLAAVAYGPCVVKAMVGKKDLVTITEETEYPFKGSVRFTIGTSKPLRFPVTFRIPAWADSVIVIYGDKSETISGKDHIRLEEKWKDGDEILLHIPMKIRTERRFNNSASILRGPLYFSLRIDKEYDSIKTKYENYGYKGSVDWKISAASDWNYGLLVDDNNPERGMTIMENPVGSYPFGDSGDPVWSDKDGKYLIYNSDPPVIIKSRGMKIDSWKMKDNSAEAPPLSPVDPEGDPVIIELVPYGSARLRITEFPVMDVTMMHDVMRPAD